MCGICGVVSFSRDIVEEATIRKMMSLQKHRGPDDEGIFRKENVGLGFVRLSIIDLSYAGHQPMVSSDGRFIVVFNGEIYNYTELREELKKLNHNFKTKTDTEVLLESYIEWGEDCLNRFNGMWAFAIYDIQKNHFFAARDRFGIKPFYYILKDKYFAFASEIPPLLCLLKNKPVPDYESIYNYLVYNRVDHSEKTFFDGIVKLKHGHSLSFKTENPIPQQIYPKRWYDLATSISERKGISDPEEFLSLFTSSLQLHLRSDVSIGVCLSGGLDSSSIVSTLYKKLNIRSTNTFSAVYGKEQAGDETEYIEELRPFLNSMYSTVPTGESLYSDLDLFIKAHAEPLPGTSPYAQFKVMELARGKAVVTLDGQGADEQMAGYHYFYGFYFKDLLRSLHFRKLLREVVLYRRKVNSSYGIQTALFFLLPESLRTEARLLRNAYLSKNFTRKFNSVSGIEGELYGAKTLHESLLNHFEFKLEHLLKWEDRNSMCFSLEARVPFLDYRLVENILASGPDSFINMGSTKYLLREGMKGILPEKIRLRYDKVGFATPQEQWFRSELWQTKIKETINSNSFNERGIIDPSKATNLNDNYLKGKTVSKEIWKCLNLELWFREFID